MRKITPQLGEWHLLAKSQNNASKIQQYWPRPAVFSYEIKTADRVILSFCNFRSIADAFRCGLTKPNLGSSTSGIGG